jgi:hypothetical protein
MPGTAAAQLGVWGGWLSKKPFQKELAMLIMFISSPDHLLIIFWAYI